MATSADYKLGEYPFPRGWFIVAQSSDVGRKPFNVHYFGQDMVLYRGESGRLVMLDAYCPHMGTHLGMNKTSETVVGGTYLEGDNIRCPFHAWRFGPDGVCNNIPYFDGPIPSGARVKSWPVEERFGIVFCWHDPEEQEPDIDLPHVPEWDDPAWVRWLGIDHLADLNHPIEIVDNTSDRAHLNHLHGGHVLHYENEVEGPYLHQRETMATGDWDEGVTDLAGHRMTTITTYFGPGAATGRFIELDAIQLICHTPIDDGTCRLWQASMLKSRSGVADDEARDNQDKLNRNLAHGLIRDAEVWKHKRPALRIMQLPTDGPFLQSRMWYSQFYNPRARAAEIVKRVEGRHFAKGTPNWDQLAAAE